VKNENCDKKCGEKGVCDHWKPQRGMGRGIERIERGREERFLKWAFCGFDSKIA